MKKRRWLALISVPALCIIAAGVVLASSSIHLPWSVVSSVGGLRSSPSYWLGDTAGQPAAGTSQSSSYRLEAGFYSGTGIAIPEEPPPAAFLLSWRMLSGGGGVRGSPSYWLGDTAGQPATGKSLSSGYRLEAGFWPGAALAVPPVILLGDANSDGKLNAVDITSVERIIAELDVQTAGADANKDGKMNALDITKVERIIAGLD